jgi:phosphatidate cytidylyltransferase
MAPLIVGPDATKPAWWAWLVYGIVIAVAGIVGDLSESLLKRDMERKDSSTWIPGLGGVLDVLDSLLIAAPAAYLCWVTGIVGP